MALCAAAVPPAPVPLDREAPWRIVDFSRDAGVQRRMVFELAFETNNTAWFAVSDGLYRYDGYHWRRFTAADGLPSSFVRSVGVTREGSLWVGTDQGAGVFDGRVFDRRGTEGRLAGPNVRRIVQTRNGALWFCCDRWPDATSPAGLTRLQNGDWRTYGLADGLPSDHLLGLFEHSNGQVIALTTGGPAVRDGERWRPIQDEGFPAGELVWDMAETPEGLVFAQGYTMALVQREGKWTQAFRSAPFCVARDGALVALVNADANTLHFGRWNGQDLITATARVGRRGLIEAFARAAPDGSIWAIGRGTILRWEYLPGLWEWWPNLPPPAFEDQQHRVWFADDTGAVVADGAEMRRIPEMRAPLLEDRQGAIWSGAATNAARWVEGRLEKVPGESSGIARVMGGVADASGGVWLFGEGVEGAWTIANCNRGAWTVFDRKALGDRNIVSVDDDPREGVWMVLSEDQAYEVVRVRADGIGKISMEEGTPRTHLPRLCVSGTHLYLFAYNGLWESRLGDSLKFHKIEAGRYGVFTQADAVGDTAAFVSQEGVNGSASILLRTRGEWLNHQVAYGQAMRLDREGWLMVADGAEFVLWQTRQWPKASYVSLPTDATITSMLRAASGDYWVGTSQGVLQLRPGSGSSRPDTILSGPASFTERTPAVARAAGVPPFAPRSDARRYSFAWRLDSGPWSDYGDWPANGLPVGDVPAGRHVLEAQARDGLGNSDPTPACLEFEVHPTPIQARPWFHPMLAGVGLLLGGLSLGLLAASHRLRRYAGGLEAQVQARTAELRDDIARRERVERELHQSEMRFRALIEQGADAITLTDSAGRVIYEGPTVGRLTGYAAEARLGHGVFDAVHPEDRPAALDALRLVAGRPGASESFLVRSVRPDGSDWWTEGTVTNLLQEPAVKAVVLNFRDVTARRRSEAERERLMQAIEQAAEIIIITDADATIQYVNPTFERITGYTRAEAIGQTPRLLKSGKHDAAFYESFWATLRRGEAWHGRLINRRKDGTLYTEEAVVSPVRDTAGRIVSYVAAKRDITLEIALQDQLVQAQKMESIGRLAGGVAHDFNNMLQAILGNAALALEERPLSPLLRESLEEIQKAAQRSAALTQQLLAFARKQTICPKVLDLNQTVSGMLKMLQRLIGEDVELVWSPGAHLWPVKMDPSQVDQILANLCVNSRDAIEREGRIVIGTDNLTIDRAYAAAHPDCVPGDYVVLGVSDNGRGMDVDTRAHLFEPFFTTKESARGTGLGLATVFGIVKQNQGLINVYSEPGQGTTVRICLPRTKEPAASPETSICPPQSRGTETLLLVEDEEQILNLGRRVLSHQGYTVLTASNPEAALAAAARHPSPIDLVVTDVVMPGMNGKVLLDRLRKRYPDIRCLFMSGYTADVIACHGVLEAGVEFLQKPFTPQALTEKVRTVLDLPVGR